MQEYSCNVESIFSCCKGASCGEKNIYKMKAVMFIFIMLATVCAILAFVPYNPPRPGQSKPFPSFPGHGPFNPKIQWPYPLPNPGH
ncbi:abaecin [Bombus vancouverensis nearcticus]|uniref:abaecin n=1 Tax=Bombus vancouverensis nearcticus TaxID=2705178 RepID=UPI00402B3E0B